MPSVPMVDVAGGSRGEKTLAESVFGVAPNRHLLYEAVKHYRAQLHRGTHATKNRALVSGGGKKPWRQKGTGRARVGSSRTPLWRHGGTVFGPQPRGYGFKLSKKVERGALRAALAEEGEGGGVGGAAPVGAQHSGLGPPAGLPAEGAPCTRCGPCCDDQGRPRPAAGGSRLTASRST